MTGPGSTDKKGLEGGLSMKEPEGAEDMGQGFIGTSKSDFHGLKRRQSSRVNVHKREGTKLRSEPLIGAGMVETRGLLGLAGGQPRG